MLTQQTLDKLHDMKLAAMANAFTEQLGQPDLNELSFEDRFAMLVDRQWTFKEDRRMTRLLRTARLRDSACIENIDFKTPRALDKSLVVRLSGSGLDQESPERDRPRSHRCRAKTYLACAIANSACPQRLCLHVQAGTATLPGSCHCPGRWLLSETDEQVIKDQGPDHRRFLYRPDDRPGTSGSFRGAGGSPVDLFHHHRHPGSRRKLDRVYRRSHPGRCHFGPPWFTTPTR